MVKITAAVFAALATLAAARNCTPGLDYCGSVLRLIAGKSGAYDAQIKAAIYDYNRNTSPSSFDMDNFLFECTGGPNGEIRVRSSCFGTKCIDSGNNNSDKCTWG